MAKSKHFGRITSEIAWIKELNQSPLLFIQLNQTSLIYPYTLFDFHEIVYFMDHGL